MNPPKKPSRQDILRQQQQTIFVGREAHLDQFRYNLKLPPESWRFLFNVWGQGGVGKSTLLRQFRKLAEDAGCITALTTDSETSVPEAMGRLAEQLAQQGHPLEAFAERYKVYRQKKQELEADPEAPQGFSAFLGKSVAKAGLGLAKQIPGSGAVTPFLDEEGMTSQAGEWASYVARKLGNKDEVRLVNEPVEVLTPLFLQGLEQLAEQTSLVLFFDVYERTADFLDRWLREILESRYGDLPLNLIGVIAGREELDRNHWADYETAMIRIPLNPFTEAEAIQYLSRKDITHPQVIEVILQLSGRLPVLLELLASTNPQDADQIGEPSGLAVERFLKWETDAKRRQIALDAALPRCLNRDVVAQLQAEDATDELFNWLIAQPFVQEQTNGRAYHEVVRSQMLRYKRLTYPQSWAALHGKLADYYTQLRNDLQLTEDQQWQDDTWQTYSLCILYHRLCQAPQKALSTALNEFLVALKAQYQFAQQWAETIVQVGQDVGIADVKTWGENLVNGLKAYDEARYSTAVEMFTALVKVSTLETQWHAVALAWRGKIYRLMKCYKEALQDFNQAINLNPKYAWALVGRGETYQRMERYEEALQNFDQAIELNPKYVWAITIRGATYASMRHFEEALQDFNQAIELDSNYPWAIAYRSTTYRNMKCFEEALQDSNQAIELNPKDAWTIAMRGQTYRLMDRYEEALQDFDRSIELNPKNSWTIARRGQTYRMIQCYEKALQDFSCAIQLNPKDLWIIMRRGETYRLMKRYEEAQRDFNWALQLNPNSDWAIGNCGHIHLILGQCHEALANFNQAIKLNANDNWRLYNRALTYLALNQPDNAKADFDRAIQLAQQKYDQDPTDWNNTFNLALYHLAAGNPAQMKHFYQDALNRGAPQARIQTAIQDLEDLLRVFPRHEWAQKAKDSLEKRMRNEK